MESNGHSGEEINRLVIKVFKEGDIELNTAPEVMS